MGETFYEKNPQGQDKKSESDKTNAIVDDNIRLQDEKEKLEQKLKNLQRDFAGAGASPSVQNVDFTESFKREHNRRLLNVKKRDEEAQSI